MSRCDVVTAGIPPARSDIGHAASAVMTRLAIDRTVIRSAIYPL